jgi:hypothetical protein
LRDFASGTHLNAIMTPIAKALTGEEIDAVAQYYATVRATAVPPPAIRLGRSCHAPPATARRASACLLAPLTSPASTHNTS